MITSFIIASISFLAGWFFSRYDFIVSPQNPEPDADIESALSDIIHGLNFALTEIHDIKEQLNNRN